MIRWGVPEPTCISRGQRRLHIAGEAAAVFLVSPFLGYLALKGGHLTKSDRYALGAIVLGSLAIDGYLLRKFTKRPDPAPPPPSP